MTDQVAIQIPTPRVKEGSAFTATAYFRDRATQAASAPAVAKYRIDNLTAFSTVQDWTSLTPATSISIAITGTHNAITSQCNRFERLQLTVAAEPGASGQVRETAIWDVENIQGF